MTFMPIAAQCSNCGGPLSETSVLALAPVCERCGTVITEIGGSLGLTSAYSVNDPTITRRRVEADLGVFREYQMRYHGSKECSPALMLQEQATNSCILIVSQHQFLFHSIYYLGISAFGANTGLNIFASWGFGENE